MLKHKPRTRKPAASKQNCKLSLRMLPEVSEQVRAIARVQGDLSRIISEALDEFKLSDPSTLPVVGGGIKPTSITLTAKRRREMRRVALESGAAESGILNGALLAWLQKHK